MQIMQSSSFLELKVNLRRVDSTLSKKWSFTILFGLRDNISIILYTLFRYNVANIYAYVYLSRFSRPQTRMESIQRKGKGFFLFKQSSSIRNEFHYWKIGPDNQLTLSSSSIWGLD